MKQTRSHDSTPSHMTRNDKVSKYKLKPRVAVNNLVFTSRAEVLLVKRDKQDDALSGLWGGIGGKVDYLEPLANASIRELKEETGLALNKPCFVGVTENISQYPHYVVVWFAYSLPLKKQILIDYSENAEYGWYPITTLPKEMKNDTRVMIQQGWRVIKSKR